MSKFGRPRIEDPVFLFMLPERFTMIHKTLLCLGVVIVGFCQVSNADISARGSLIHSAATLGASRVEIVSLASDNFQSDSFTMNPTADFDSFSLIQTAAIPEPASACVLTLVGLGQTFVRRRR